MIKSINNVPTEHAQLLEDLYEFFQEKAIPEAEAETIMLYAAGALAALRGKKITLEWLQAAGLGHAHSAAEMEAYNISPIEATP